MKIFMYSTPFYYNPPPCPFNALLINHISWKSKLKHTSVDIKCFFPRCTIFTKKTKSVFGSVLWNQSNI